MIDRLHTRRRVSALYRADGAPRDAVMFAMRGLGIEKLNDATEDQHRDLCYRLFDFDERFPELAL